LPNHFVQQRPNLRHQPAILCGEQDSERARYGETVLSRNATAIPLVEQDHSGREHDCQGDGGFLALAERVRQPGREYRHGLDLQPGQAVDVRVAGLFAGVVLLTTMGGLTDATRGLGVQVVRFGKDGKPLHRRPFAAIIT
jgi:hypothetical protein